jgi:hypothetical protein
VSAYWSISGVTDSLVGLLDTHITQSGDSQIKGVPVSDGSPKDVREDLGTTHRGISVWLYRVTRNPDLLNAPPTREAADELPYHPLPVDLHYLVTPLAGDRDDEQVLFGRVLQVLNDHTIIRGTDLVSPPLDPERVELRVLLDTLSLEDLTRVWNALQESYALSIGYVVQVVEIESHHEPRHTSPVVVREDGYHQIVASR